MTRIWTWVAPDVVLAVHDRQLAEHGGREGVRGEELLSSALARPENAVAYGTPDVADLAAAYAFGVARDHAFVDGDKRTAWVVARLFLALNGVALKFEPAEAISAMEALASGVVDEPQLAAWFRARIG